MGPHNHRVQGTARSMPPHNSALDFFKLLSDIGYKGYFFMNKKLKSINEFNLEIHQKSGEGRFWEKKGYVNNFIFVKKGHNI